MMIKNKEIARELDNKYFNFASLPDKINYQFRELVTQKIMDEFIDLAMKWW